MNPLKTKSKLLDFIFYSLLVILLVYQVLFLVNVGFYFSDTDQVLMWLGARDYSNGIFMEPRFYGQSYNTFFEGLLAVPLLKLGVPVYKAVPLVSNLMSVTPFILLSFVSFYRKSKWSGIFVLAIALSMFVEYKYIASVPRGFIPGIFVSSFLFLFLFKELKTRDFFLIVSFTILGFSLNPNSLVLSIPLCLYFGLPHLKNRQFYIGGAIALLIFGSLHLASDLFYHTHPFYVLHQLNLDFSILYFYQAFQHLDQHFHFVVPFFEHGAVIVLLTLIGLSYFFYWKEEKRLSTLIFTTTIFILFTLFFSKSQDGFNNLILPKSRLFLALPIVLCLFLVLSERIPKSIFISLFVISLPFTVLSFMGIWKFQHLPGTPYILALNTEATVNECKVLNAYCKENQVGLVVTRRHFSLDYFNHACPACEEDFPKTLRPDYERRTWRLLEDENKVYRNILIIDADYDYADEKIPIHVIDSNRGYYLIQENEMKTMDLLKELKIPVRAYR